jgi:hypothetical protein
MGRKNMEAENLEERTMHAMPGTGVEPTPISPREQLDQRLTVIETRARDLAQRHGRLAAGIAVTAAAAFGLGVLLYRRRGRKSMVKRAQHAIPDSFWDMPEELIAQLKKPIKRAAKAL